MSSLSNRLRELRGETSQSEMARQLGIVRQQWIKYETGQSAPGAEMLATICRVHACSADWLLGLRDSATPRETKTNIRAGANSAVAVGANARATVRAAAASPGEMPACAKCPHLKKLKKFEELLKQV